MALVFLGGGETGGSRVFCKTAELVAAVTSFVEVLRDLQSQYYLTFISNNCIFIIIYIYRIWMYNVCDLILLLYMYFNKKGDTSLEIYVCNDNSNNNILKICICIFSQFVSRCQIHGGKECEMKNCLPF